MVVVYSHRRRVVARVCITPSSEDQLQKGRLLKGGRSFGPSAFEQAALTKAFLALLFP